MLGEAPTDDIDDSFGEADKKKKKKALAFTKTKKQICLRLHYNDQESHLYVNKKKICKIQGLDNFTTFQLA